MVTPRRWDIPGIQLIQSMATVVATTVTTGAQATKTAETKTSAEVWIYNVSRTPGAPVPLRPVVSVKQDRASTLVMRLRLDLTDTPADLKGMEPNKLAKQELSAQLGDTKILDNWAGRINDEQTQLITLVRVLATQEDALLRCSGQGSIWADTPPRRDAEVQPGVANPP